MKPAMRQTAYKVSATRNAYGDYVAGSQTALPCHFRYITQLDVQNGNEAIRSTAMAWFEADSGIIKGDILKIDSEGWKVDSITKARRLHNPNILFLKANLTKYGMIS